VKQVVERAGNVRKGQERNKVVNNKVECWGRRKEFQFPWVVKVMATGHKAGNVSVKATPYHPISR